MTIIASLLICMAIFAGLWIWMFYDLLKLLSSLRKERCLKKIIECKDCIFWRLVVEKIKGHGMGQCKNPVHCSKIACENCGTQGDDLYFKYNYGCVFGKRKEL